MNNTVTFQNKSDSHVDFFLAIAVVVFFFNLLSQIVALPVQIVLLFYALTRFDVRYLSAIFVLTLDKSYFPYFEADLIKIDILFSLSIPYIVVIFCFLISWWGLLQRKFDAKIRLLFVLWLVALVFAFILSWSARETVSYWQAPISLTVCLGLYFWGILIGKSWNSGKEYFCKRLILILSPLSVLWSLGWFRIPSFSLQVMVVCLTMTCFYILSLRKWLLWVMPGFVSAIYYVFFGSSTYIMDSSYFGEGISAQISTFGTIFNFLFGLGLAYTIITMRGSRRILKMVPYISVCASVVIILYAVGRYRETLGKDVQSQFITLRERFESKLIGDRGAVWSQGVEDMFMPPYFFKRMEDSLEYGPQGSFQMKCQPHNQYLTLIVEDGWILGNVLAFFLLFFFIKSFDIISKQDSCIILGSVLLSSMGAIYMSVGLVGQSLLGTLFCGNAIATLVFPGIIYGAYNESRTDTQSKMAMRFGNKP